MKGEWNHLACNSCWERMNPGREAVRVAVKKAEACCFCRGLTVSGIFVRRDPADAGLLCGKDDDPARTQPFIIDQLHAFIAADENGHEGVVAFGHGDTVLPMIAADEKRIASLRPMVVKIAKETGRPIRLMRFFGRQVLEEIKP